MSVSAGIIPYRFNKNKEIEFFVGHPGGPYWKNDPYYAFLKGGLEDGENTLTAAIREFEEESGIKVPDISLINLGSVKQNSKKVVYAYGALFDIDPDKCFSNECEVEHPSKSGQMIKIPEIDRYAWMTYSELSKITNEKHLPFYQKIINFNTNIINEHYQR